MKEEPEKADSCTDERFEEKPSTQRVRGSRTSHELIAHIEADSSNLRIPNLPQAESMFIFLVCALILFYASTLVGFLLNLIDITDVIYFIGFLPILIFGSLCLCNGCCYAFERRNYGLVMNKIGIGWKSFRNVAIEWEHVDHIEIWHRRNEISRIYIFGNERMIMHKNSRWSLKLTQKMIGSYIPDFSTWYVSREASWSEGIYRYSRVESNDSTGEVVEEPF